MKDTTEYDNLTFIQGYSRFIQNYSLIWTYQRPISSDNSQDLSFSPHLPFVFSFGYYPGFVSDHGGGRGIKLIELPAECLSTQTDESSDLLETGEYD